MAKRIKLLCDPTMIFSSGTTTIRVTDLTIEQAEEVESQYPGLYVQVIEEKPASKPKAE